MCVCTYTYTYIYIYIYISIYVYIYVYIYNIYIYIHTHTTHRSISPNSTRSEKLIWPMRIKCRSQTSTMPVILNVSTSSSPSVCFRRKRSSIGLLSACMSSYAYVCILIMQVCIMYICTYNKLKQSYVCMFVYVCVYICLCTQLWTNIKTR